MIKKFLIFLLLSSAICYCIGLSILVGELETKIVDSKIITIKDGAYRCDFILSDVGNKRSKETKILVQE